MASPNDELKALLKKTGENTAPSAAVEAVAVEEMFDGNRDGFRLGAASAKAGTDAATAVAAILGGAVLDAEIAAFIAALDLRYAPHA